MAKKNFPRSGSLAYYPKKRAKKETPTYKAVKLPQTKEAKPLCFIGYKVGMTHVIAKNTHEHSKTFGQDTMIPVTLIECPPLIVFGVRAYHKTPQGTTVKGETYAHKIAKELVKRIPNFKKKSPKQKKKKKEEKKETTIVDLKNDCENTTYFTLIAHTQPKLTDSGKKKPDVFEVRLSGTVEQQAEFAESILGKEISIRDCFEQGTFIDVKAVDKGKGMQGPVKRAGIRIHRPKAKKRRVVGSISPWSPATVMWTVARPGQLGYQTRTEYNRRILLIGDKTKRITPSSGFKKYGRIQNDFLMVSGSVPGPAKRAIALRHALRPTPEHKGKIEMVDYIATRGLKQEYAAEEEAKAEKVELVKEKKAEKKSVQDEIAEAAKGGKK